jgi:hypothetical protein
VENQFSITPAFAISAKSACLFFHADLADSADFF